MSDECYKMHYACFLCMVPISSVAMSQMWCGPQKDSREEAKNMYI